MNHDAAHLVEGPPLVLVIDDTEDVFRLLSPRLRTEGVEIRYAGSGDEGLRAARNDHPALILLDLDMPGRDGYEILRLLKDDPATLDISVIMLSAKHSPQDKAAAFDLGAVDYITRPFDLNEARARIRSALRLHEALQMLSQRAQIDGLTGLWNRAHFDQRWDEAVAHAVRHGRPLSLAMLDADHFKRVNDTYGHPAGDAALQGIARVIRRESRGGDIACRYGGEEFVVILPETEPGAAVNLSERIRTAIADTVWSRHPEHPITVSIGLAGAAIPGPVTRHAWLDQADRNLYAAKAAGRNRTVCSEVAARSSKAG